MSEKLPKNSENESLRNIQVNNMSLEKMKSMAILALLSLVSVVGVNNQAFASEINKLTLQNQGSNLIAQNSPRTELRIERRGDRVFKENPNFPFLLFDSAYQSGQEIKVPPISNEVPNFANPNMNDLLSIILNSPNTYDDFVSLNLTYRNVFGISGQNMTIEQQLKVGYDDPNTKLIPNKRDIVEKQTITFRQGNKPGETRGNVSFIFNKSGCYMQIFYPDEYNIKTLVSIFGEEAAKELLKKADLDNFRKVILIAKEQQTLIQKSSELK